MKIRFPADGDLNEDIVTGVIRRVPEIDFQTTTDAELSGVVDEQVLAFCAREGRALVSHYWQTMPYHFADFAYRSGQFLRGNQIQEAVAEGRQAVEFAPEDPRTHLSLGLALVRAGQRDEARKELEKAFELAKANPAFRNAEVRARLELERLK